MRKHVSDFRRVLSYLRFCTTPKLDANLLYA